MPLQFGRDKVNLLRIVRGERGLTGPVNAAADPLILIGDDTIGLAPATSGYALLGQGVGDTPAFLGFQRAETGGVSRTWQSKAQERRTVFDFNATGDGVASDSDAFGDAYNATPEDGLLIIPQGTYEITNAIFDSDTKDFTVVGEPGVVFNSSTDVDNAFKGRLRPTDLSALLNCDSFELSSKQVTGSWAHRFSYWNVPDDGSTTASEKMWSYVIVNNQQSQDSATQDVVIADWRIRIPSTNTNGNSFGIFLQPLIESGGDGVLRGIEIGMQNEGTAVTGVDAAKNKKALNLLADGSNPCTAAAYIGGGTGFYKGVYASATGITSNAESSFLEHVGRFRVDRNGKVTADKFAIQGSAPTTETVIASRCTIPASLETELQCNSRTVHTAVDALTSVKLVLPNWYADNTGEHAVTGSASVTASIEYPLGTFTQVLFSGVATGSIPTGTTLVSDAVTVAIPRGATFYTRVFFTSASGGVPTRHIAKSTVLIGDRTELAASGLTDKTMSGTIGTDNGMRHYFPLAIIGKTSTASVLIIGDSRQATGFDQRGNWGQLMPMFHGRYGVISAGVSAETAQLYVASHALRNALATYVSHVVVAYGINDFIVSGRTLAQAKADLTTIYGYFPTKKVYQATLTPNTTSSDQWKSISGQSDSVGADRIDLNDWIRGGSATGLTGYLEIADAVESSRNSGFWKANGYAYAYTGDGLHESFFGVGEITRSRDPNDPIGLGNGVCADLPELALVSDTATATVTFGRRLAHETSGTVTASFGVGDVWDMENSAGAMITAARASARWSSVGTDSAIWTLDLVAGGSLAARFDVLPFGDVLSRRSMTIYDGTSIPAGGAAGTGYKFSSVTNFGFFFGSGAPTLAAAKGSYYARSDGSGTNDRAYINTDGSTTWTPVVTVG